METEELNKVEYAAEFMDNFYKSISDSLLPIFDCERINEEEYKNSPNPLGSVGDIIIENLLINFAGNPL